MKKTVLALLGSCITALTFGQAEINQKLIELGKTYKDFMFRNTATKEVLKDAKANVPESLVYSTDFIVQTITTKNKLLSQQYLTRPDDQTLRQIFIIRAINHNLREENQIDNNKLIDSLNAAEIPAYELVDNYYGMLFTAVGNKNQPFNLAKVDFKLKDYKFKDETEKGIFFLRCMKDCNSVIWGYMNVVKPPNTKNAYENINKFPEFNGQPYYQYSDFYFTDFEMNIIKDQGRQSYKSYYLDKYFETLLFHLICLNREGGSEKEKNDLLLGSILKDSNLYKYTNYQDTLKEIFKVQKQ
ncbi:hypothetical protein [Flavihumibacter solisilvae]|uniref:Uncharacterized protein n=1 Tax=Flavihumibacter solisilvae TaxID=1349421 RepID=A0A0C1KYX2_9BACT|nr:hypothetical protein [Flavihumibacter solisilvae]KIC92892.1 hypothetical protein OI18_21000 [Flavihumibacter solisilvae]